MGKRSYVVAVAVFVVLVLVAIAMRGEGGLLDRILPALHGR